MTIVTTERLRMEPFAPPHAEGLHVMNSNPDVMRYIGPVQSLEETKIGIARVQDRWARLGYGWWAVFLKDSDTLIGAACLQNLAHDESKPLEIGWRFLPDHHGKGYATEAGQAAMDFGFEAIGVDYVCAVADPDNIRSRKVMQRLGMRYVGIQTHYENMPTAFYEKHRD